jgi:hypothetical protein
MRLYVMFGQRAEKFEGQFAPEALDVIDEYTADENGAYMDTATAAAKEKYGEDFVNIMWFPVDIEGAVEATIRKILLADMDALKAKIVDPTEPERVTRNQSIKVRTDVVPGTIQDDEIY